MSINILKFIIKLYAQDSNNLNEKLVYMQSIFEVEN